MSSPNTTAAGYGYQHQQLRKRWAEILERDGIVTCHARDCVMPSRVITVDMPWHLGHSEDRTRHTGPEHERCNTTDGGRRRHAERPKKTWPL